MVPPTTALQGISFGNNASLFLMLKKNKMRMNQI